MSLTIKSLNQLLDEPDTQGDLGEAEYRRGYRDGYSAVINALFELPVNVVTVDSDLLCKLFAHWQKTLSAWQEGPLSQPIEPPLIEWHKQSAGEISSPVSVASPGETSAKCLDIKFR